MSTTTPRILIVRLSAVGDAILTLPVLNALRVKFPHAHLAWAAQAGAASLLKGHAALDQLIVVPKDWFKSWQQFSALRQTLRAGKFEFAIDVQGLTKSAGIAWFAGAKRRLGFHKGDFYGREFSTWLNNELLTPTAEHIVDQQLELLQLLGVSPPKSRSAEVRFDVPRLPADVAAVDGFIQERQLPAEFVLIQPGAGWPSKLWPTDRYAAVAEALRQHGLQSLVLWSGNEEQKLADEIARLSNGAAVQAPPTTLPQLAEFARRARFFLGPDTGPLHLAAAVNCPCVGLYGPMSASRCGPYGLQHVELQNTCLAGGARARRQADNESMKAISVADVVTACEQILAKGLRLQAA